MSNKVHLFLTFFFISHLFLQYLFVLLFCFLISTRFGLQGLSSDMVEARLIAGKLAEKLKRSKAVLLSQHIGRAMLGFQKLGKIIRSSIL